MSSNFLTVPNSMNGNGCRRQQFTGLVLMDNNEAQVCRLSPYCVNCGDTCDAVIICDTCSPHTGSDGRYAILPPLYCSSITMNNALCSPHYIILPCGCADLGSGAAVVRCTRRRWQHCVLFVRETPLLSARFLFPSFWLLLISMFAYNLVIPGFHTWAL